MRKRLMKRLKTSSRTVNPSDQCSPNAPIPPPAPFLFCQRFMLHLKDPDICLPADCANQDTHEQCNPDIEKIQQYCHCHDARKGKCISQTGDEKEMPTIQGRNGKHRKNCEEQIDDNGGINKTVIG